MSYTRSFSAIEALVRAYKSSAKPSTVQCIVAFDNEEVGTSPPLHPSNPVLSLTNSVHSLTRSPPSSGSTSHQGANSNFFEGLISRLSPVSRDVVLSRSFMLSCDTAHAAHPGWPDRHQRAHRPRMGGGPSSPFLPSSAVRLDGADGKSRCAGVVVKTSAKQSYTSTALTTFVVRRVAEMAAVPLQEFEVRNDVSPSLLAASPSSSSAMRS